MVIFFNSVKSVVNLSAFSAPNLFLMLDHTEMYVEKIHSIDAELAGHAHKLSLTWNCTGYVGAFFSVCYVHAYQALPIRSELTNNTLQKQRQSTFLQP